MSTTASPPRLVGFRHLFHDIASLRQADKQDNVRLEDSLPVVTHFAFKIQEHYNSLVQMEEDEMTEKTFVVSELLKLAVNLDYADENGRRQMFSLTRELAFRPATCRLCPVVP